MSPKLSPGNLNKLTKAHLSSLKTSNKAGIFDGMLADTQTLYDDFVGQLSDHSTTQSEKEGKTISLDALGTRVKSFVSDQENNVAYIFKEGTAEYQEFFPRGIVEYRTARKDDLSLLFGRFVKVCEKYGIRMGNNVAIDARQLLTDYNAARKDQVDKKETIRDMADSGADKRSLLAMGLYRNLGLLIARNAENPTLVNNYFDFSFLPKNKGDDGKTPPPPSQG